MNTVWMVILPSCWLLLAGCATKAIVRRPYGEVCPGMVRMTEQINDRAHQSIPALRYDLEGKPNQRREYPFARIQQTNGCVISIEEDMPQTIVNTYTLIRSEPVDPRRTKIVVKSWKTGLIFDSRERKLENQRLNEVLTILEIKK